MAKRRTMPNMFFCKHTENTSYFRAQLYLFLFTDFQNLRKQKWMKERPVWEKIKRTDLQPNQGVTSLYLTSARPWKIPNLKLFQKFEYINWLMPWKPYQYFFYCAKSELHKLIHKQMLTQVACINPQDGGHFYLKLFCFSDSTQTHSLK